MQSRHRAVITISVPPETATEYRDLARSQGETISELFRDMFAFYKQEKLKKELYSIQEYGAGMVREMALTEEEIEKMVLEGR
ncbi:MAG: CopG family transcriptional regulator [Geobacter sp.]|nr:CopG family transcriptional regulator [Geobacter sp.]